MQIVLIATAYCCEGDVSFGTREGAFTALTELQPAFCSNRTPRPCPHSEGWCANVSAMVHEWGVGLKLPLKLACPAGSKIRAVDFASYGEVTGSCAGSFRQGSCHLTDTRDRVARLCTGKQRCTIQPEFRWTLGGGDPCEGVKKSLAVQVSCDRVWITPACKAEDSFRGE